MFENIPELSLYGVQDAGIPNMERVVIKVDDYIDLSSVMLLVALRGKDGTGIPLRDNALWFGTHAVKRGDWIYVYTAPGETTISRLPNSESDVLSVHWGRRQTFFQDKHIMPILIRIGGVKFPLYLPELASGQDGSAQPLYLPS